MLNGRALCEFTDHRQNVGFVPAGLDDHEDRNGQQQAFEDPVQMHTRIGKCETHGADDPLHHQPGSKQIEALERVESNHCIRLKTPGGQNNYCRDPANGRDIATDGSSSGGDIGERILPRVVRRGRRRSEGTSSAGFRCALSGSTVRAKLVRVSRALSALCAKCHGCRLLSTVNSTRLCHAMFPKRCSVGH